MSMLKDLLIYLVAMCVLGPLGISCLAFAAGVVSGWLDNEQ
jgi:hypothetical protein